MSKQFIPSAWRLTKMIDAAMAKADAALEQDRLREEARADERYARRWAAEADAIRRRRLFGV